MVVKADNVLLAPVGGGASDTAGGGRAGSAVWSAAARVRNLPQRLRAAALPQERATDGGSFRGPPQPRDAGQYGAGMCPAAATAHGAVAPSGAGWNAHRCERSPGVGFIFTKLRADGGGRSVAEAVRDHPWK